MKNEELLIDVIKVEALENYKLKLTFENGKIKMFDMREYLELPVFEKLKNIEEFKTARIDFGTVVWDEKTDMAPDELYANSYEI